MLSLRNDIRMTQVDMGKVLGVSRHTVLSWEAGEKYPNSENLQRFIALAFEHGAFPGGEEAAAIQKLWEASRQKVLLDRVWLDTLLLRHAPATPHRADNETQTTTERHVFVNLPFQPTSFVGRANELAQLAVILNRSDCRLLTLLGPGGVGKTRLGLELAEHTSNFFRDGVVFVGLAALRTPDQVVLAMGESLGLSFFKQADATASLLDYLRERSILLILDNFEHLLEGVEVVNAVLAHAPRVKVLTTSRERLNLQAEWIFDVEGLSYPTNVTETSAPRSLEALRDYAAITLFVQRALQVQPELTYSEATLSIIVNVCQHVAGLPLAIELAAASLRTSTLAVVERQILSNLTALSTTLRDVPPRHRSLRATFDHSWDLLDEAERALLSRLTIFRGSWDQAAVQTICKDHTERPTGGNHEESNTPSPHLLASLVDKSLVRQINVKTVEPRFVLLEPIREYALEHLTARGEAELVQLAHTSYYMALAEEAAAQLGSLTTEAAMELLNLEHDNLLAALTWVRDRNDYVTGFRLGTTLVRFWRWGGFLSEGRRWLEELLALKGDVTDSDDVLTLHLQAVQGAAWLAFDQQDHKRASELFEQSRLLQLSLGKTEEDPKQSMNVALQARSVGDYSRARALLERTVSKHQALDSRQHLNPSRSEPSAIGLSVILLAWCLRDQGDIAGAKAIFEKRAAVCREIGDPRGLATALQGLSCVASDVGDSAGVRNMVKRASSSFVPKPQPSGWLPLPSAGWHGGHTKKVI
jgi:predicted ATPase/DNA-binding XRE family transcriptional regulator